MASTGSAVRMQWASAGLRRKGKGSKMEVQAWTVESFGRVGRHTYFCRLAICFTASTAPGRGSSSKKKSFDSQMLIAFS